jgi:hypothetical protein
MSIEILYYDGCPTYRAAEETVRGVLAEQGIEATVELVAVNTDDEARQARFPGSPTIRVAGRDFFPVAERDDWRLGCRVYATPEGLRGSPSRDVQGGSAESSRSQLGMLGGVGPRLCGLFRTPFF